MNSKKGLAFVGLNADQIAHDAMLLGGSAGAAWYYTWSPMTSLATANGAEFVPMLWDDTPGQWKMLEENWSKEYAGHILFLNEPNHPMQANLTPERAAIAYRRLRMTYPKVKIVAPALWDRPIRDEATGEWSHDGDHWLTEWREAHWRLYRSYPDPAAYAIHYYTGRQPAEAVRRFRVEWFLQNDGRPGVTIWLTEFRFCNQWWRDAPDFDLAAQMRKEIRRLESLTYLERYAYYANRNYDPVVTEGCDIALCNDAGLTPLGKVFMSL